MSEAPEVAPDPKPPQLFAGEVSAAGKLRLFNPAGFTTALLRLRGRRVALRLLGEAAIRSDRQNRYWWGVCVETVRRCWQHATAAPLPLPKEAVHDALVASILGTIETPLGRVRVRTKTLPVERMTYLIDETRSYARERYQSEIPSPEEWAEHNS